LVSGRGLSSTGKEKEENFMVNPLHTVNNDVIYIDGRLEWTDEAKAKHTQKAWLEDALPLEVLCSDDANLGDLTTRLFEEIESRSGQKFKLQEKTKNQLAMIMSNLSFGKFMDKNHNNRFRLTSYPLPDNCDYLLMF